MSENDTTKITTTEDKRPSKNLIEFNLPKLLQTSVGHCQRKIKKSSQKASAMIDPVMTKCKESITPKMIKFCNVDLSSIMPTGFTRDNKYTNCIVAPLKILLDKND